MRIAISGLSGCGNTSTSLALSKKLGYKLVNFTFKNLAEEKGIEFYEFCAMAKTNFEFDRELDRRQVEMAMKEENVILSSRLAIWMLKEADFRVFLEASESVRAERVYKREGGTLEEHLVKTKKRDESDHNRYLEIYAIDNNNYSFADLIINTDNYTADEVANIIYEKVRCIKNG